MKNEDWKKLEMQDNFPIYLDASSDLANALLRENVDFEFIKEDVCAMRGIKYQRFNYGPGTVFVDSREHQPYEPAFDQRFYTREQHEELKRILGLSHLLMLHTEQGESYSVGNFNVVHPGVRSKLPDEVMIEGSVESLVKMLVKGGIRACLPGGFEIYQSDENLAEVCWI